MIITVAGRRLGDHSDFSAEDIALVCRELRDIGPEDLAGVVVMMQPGELPTIFADRDHATRWLRLDARLERVARQLERFHTPRGHVVILALGEPVRVVSVPVDGLEEMPVSGRAVALGALGYAARGT